MRAACMRTACRAVCVLTASLLGACSAPAQRDGALARHLATAHALPNAELVKQGYRVMKRGRQLVYCRSQNQTGSLISSTVCLTEDQVRMLEQNTQQSKDLLSQPRGGRNCPRGDCSKNGG
jgi:hypothetical protein